MIANTTKNVGNAKSNDLNSSDLSRDFSMKRICNAVNVKTSQSNPPIEKKFLKIYSIYIFVSSLNIEVDRYHKGCPKT